MFRKVLFPLDGSGWGDRVVRLVRPLITRQATVHLLTVVERAGDIPTVEERLDAAGGHLERLRADLEPASIAVETELVVGADVADSILQAIARHGPDLVVMPTHARSGPSRWLTGSVAEAVSRRSDVPVLLVSEEALCSETELRLRRLLLPLDGTPEAQEAVLPLAEQLARDHGAEVLLLHVAEPVPPAAAAAGVAVAPMTAVPPLSALLEGLEPACRRLEQAGLRARALAAYGPGPAEILDVAARYDAGLILMATHGRRGLERWLFGSTAESVVRHGARPVLVLRLRGAPAERTPS